MALTVNYIVALLSLSGVGKQSVRKVCSLTSDFLDKTDLIEALKSLKIYYKNEANKKTQITLEVLSKALDSANDLIYTSEQQGIKLISYYDNNFPKCLKTPAIYEGKESCPLLIHYKGNLDLLNHPKLTIIGSRNSIKIAEKAAFYLSKEFADRSICIVSGLATGIDSFAHKGCLSSTNGKTIAVVGNGLDIVYPKENQQLAEDILAKGGLFITENIIGESPKKYSLVQRDKIQGTIANSTIVVQSAIDGGSMYAAKVTANLNKPLYVVKYYDSAINNLDCMSGNRYLVEKMSGIYLSAVKDKKVMLQNMDDLAKSVKSAFTNQNL